MKDYWLTELKMARNGQKRHARPLWVDFDVKGGNESFPNFFCDFFSLKLRIVDTKKMKHGQTTGLKAAKS